MRWSGGGAGQDAAGRASRPGLKHQQAEAVERIVAMPEGSKCSTFRAGWGGGGLKVEGNSVMGGELQWQTVLSDDDHYSSVTVYGDNVRKSLFIGYCSIESHPSI
jgi:hypothetical protein